MKEETKIILKRLLNGSTLARRYVGMSNKNYIKLLFNMKDDGLIDFELIEDHPVYKGEPKNIRLTEKGKKAAKNIND